ncbi:hypothetical protein BKA00_006625 [Actinomadura coerulea]|uniref:Uncharacterized protein n=1 Tax=Actinomadura coerulea TaxID=46159 RepID=A0A7X0G5C8_9ACTN|nr:hypothetical protein [Actinomadura coerulea]MBB6399711.1 hypothetical protein [Actinomadura coerulea]GGQ11788.1 hypothetical protein GCM10010187_29880 [Actinomadura coerulea]
MRINRDNDTATLVTAVIALFFVLVTFLLNDGADFICIAIGGGLVVGGYVLNRRSWTSHSGTDSVKRPLTGSIVLTSFVMLAIFGSGGDSGLSHIVTGFGGTGLVIVLWLLFKHFVFATPRDSK